MCWLDREQSCCSAQSLPPWAWELLQRAQPLATCGRLAEAQSLIDQALAGEESRSPREQDALAWGRLRMQLGSWCHQLGQHAKAEQYLLAAFEVLDAALGTDCPETAAILAMLAAVYDSAGLPNQALEVQQQVLGIRQRALGPGDPAVAMAWAAVAAAMVTAGQPTVSTTCWQEALNALEASMPQWLPTYERLGQAYVAVLQDAGLQQEIAIFEKRLRRLQQLHS